MLPVLFLMFGAVFPMVDVLFALLVFGVVGRRIPHARLLSCAVAASGFVSTCCLPAMARASVPILVCALGVVVHYLLLGCLITVLLHTAADKVTTPPLPPPPPLVPPEPSKPQPNTFSDLPRYPE